MEFDFLMFPDAPDIALMAHGNVAVISAQNHLGTLGDNITITDSGIDSGLGATDAHGLDFLDAVGQFHEASAAGEEPGLEVGPQAEAHDRYVAVIDDGPELVDLLFRQELTFITDHSMAAAHSGLPEPVVNIHIRCHHLYFCCQANAAAQNLHAIPGIRRGLDEPNLHIIFFVIIFGDQCLGCFAGTHGAVFKVKLRHFSFYLRSQFLLYRKTSSVATLIHAKLTMAALVYPHFV